ncbi:MAG: UDP-2,3-diacylglucosamine diphosphatase [bacterium]
MLQEKTKKTKIDTLIISDLHLGFRFSRTVRLLSILKKYDFNQLIVNGDIFDNLDLTRLETEHWEVLSYLRKISKDKKVVWIVGNHDGRPDILSNLIGAKVFDYFIWEMQGKKYLAIHGHQFDRFLHKNIFLSNIAEAFYYFVKKYELQNKNMLISNWIKRNNRSWLRLSNEVARGAMRFARRRECDYVFCGHTHIDKHVKGRRIEYFNSGSWIERPAHYITIKGDKIKINEVP